MAEEDKNLADQVRSLRKQVEELVQQRDDVGSVLQLEQRLSAIESSRHDAFGWDVGTPDASRSGDLMDVRKMPGREPERFKVLPNDVEFGKPTANVTTDVATVTLQPCDESGNTFANAATATVYVANDRQTQATANRGWTESTILTFQRFMLWKAGTPNIVGVLIGEAKTDILQPGDIILRAWTDVRTGFLDCNGQSVLVATYTALHNVIGYSYGGAGANFNVPNYGGLALRGFGATPFNSITATGGLIKNDLDHEHTYGDYCQVNEYPGATGVWKSAMASSSPTWLGNATYKPDANHEVDNRGPWHAIKVLIKT